MRFEELLVVDPAHCGCDVSFLMGTLGDTPTYAVYTLEDLRVHLEDHFEENTLEADTLKYLIDKCETLRKDGIVILQDSF